MVVREDLPDKVTLSRDLGEEKEQALGSPGRKIAGRSNGNGRGSGAGQACLVTVNLEVGEEAA